ncbi:MAG: type II secretion system F family protein [Granulosicoccaceae bacterium]
MLVPPAVLALFAVNLSYLLQGGMPLQAALTLLTRSESSTRFRQLIDQLSKSVQAGSMLSAAMRKHLNVFGEVSIALVEAAERDGTLGRSFIDIAELINREAASRDQLRNAMAYPLLLCIAVLITLVFMIAYLTPAVKPLLMSVGATPGLITQALFWLADDMAVAAASLALLPGLMCVFFVLSKFNVAARFYWHRCLLSVWMVGDARRDILYARLCRVVARLLDSGWDIDKALAIANSSIGNLFISDELQKLRLQMQVGNRFSQSLSVLSTAPMILEPLMIAAESSGDVAPALHRAAWQLEEQANTMLKRFTALVPPFLVCALGFILLALVVGLLAPIFSSAITMGAS